mgnify:FL=1
MSEEYRPQIFMAALAGGKKVDCYFTNGAVRRYDVNRAIRLGGVFAPLRNQKVFERAVTVMDGVLSFDISGKRDPYDMVDICADVVYADGTAV